MKVYSVNWNMSQPLKQNLIKETTIIFYADSNVFLSNCIRGSRPFSVRAHLSTRKLPKLTKVQTGIPWCYYITVELN